MKTSLLLLAAGSLLLGSCKSGTDITDQTNPAPTATGATKAASVISQVGPFTNHPISVSLKETDPDSDSHQVTWKLRGAGHQGRSELIHSNEVVQWHFASNFFLYFDEAKSEFTNWDKCTDADGKGLPWTNCICCPFDQTHHRALCATNVGDWVVSVVFPPYGAPHGSGIKYRLVTGFDCLQAGKRALPYDYYMVEATLVWDSAGFKESSNAPSR